MGKNFTLIPKQGVSFFDNATYSDKVLRQMKGGDFHAFPQNVILNESFGTVTTIKGGDDVIRQMLEIPGGYKGKRGVFEFIKDPNGQINHRFFRATK